MAHSTFHSAKFKFKNKTKQKEKTLTNVIYIIPFKLQGVRTNSSYPTEIHCTDKHMEQVHIHHSQIFIK